MDSQKQISKNIKDLRKARGYKAVDLAMLLNVSKATISQWENGDPPKKIETIRKIADVIDVSVNMLLDISGTDYSVLDNESIDLIVQIFNNYVLSPDKILSSAEREMVLLMFQSLNRKGRQELLKHGNMLIKIPEYTEKEKD